MTAGFVAGPEAEVESAFLAVIDMTMEDEGIDRIEVADFLIRIGVSGGLKKLAVRFVGGVESLFGKNDAAGLTFVEQFGTTEMFRELFDVFERDAWGVCRVRGGFVVPGAAIKKIFGIGMEREVPIEVSAFLCAFGEIIDEGTSGESLLGVAVGVADVPMMFERKINARVRGMFTDGGVRGSNGVEIVIGEFLHADTTHVVPEPV